MYYINREKELNYSDVAYYIQAFTSQKLSRLNRLKRYYDNQNDGIRNRTFEDVSKPNNKIAHSFGEYIVKTNVSMLLGSPVAYSSESDLDDYNDVLLTADEEDINIDIATNMGIYGYAVQILYLDDVDIKFYVPDNRETILIYSDDIKKELLYCIRFWKTTTVDNIVSEHVEVYNAAGTKRYKNGALVEAVPNAFDSIPVVVYDNNTDLKGDFENIIDLIDEYDLITSDTANENDYFNNAYLYLNTESVDAEDIRAMKENRVIYGPELNPQFVLKNSNNADIENEKNRIVKDIHKLSFVPDLSDENFANNVSGVAMKYKLFGTLNNIAAKQRKFKKALMDRNKLIFGMMYTRSLTVPEWVDITFTTTLPENSTEIAQTINQLRGLVSDETLVAQLPFVQDANYEVEKAKEQNSVADIYGGDAEDEE